MTRFNRLEFEQFDEGSEQSAQHANPAHRPRRAMQQSKLNQQPTLSDLERDERHWMRQADENRRDGNYENALRYYSRAVEVEKTLVAAWVGQVQMLVHLQEYPEADLWARKALELFKNNPDLLAGRTQALGRRGDLKTAMGLCDQALAQPGNHWYVWLTRGEMMLMRKDPVQDYCFDRAQQAEDDWLVPMEIGLIYLHHKKPAKAIGRLRRVTERAPQHAHGWFLQGTCEAGMGLWQPAQRSFKMCLDLKPNHVPAKAGLEEARKKDGTRGLLRRMFGQ